jgi:chemotaxis response regulator CheB
MVERIKILVFGSSRLLREVVLDILAEAPEIDVVAEVPEPEQLGSAYEIVTMSKKAKK